MHCSQEAAPSAAPTNSRSRNLLTRFRRYCLSHAISRTMISPCPSSVLVPTNLHGPLKSTVFAFRFLRKNRQNPFFSSLGSQSKPLRFWWFVRVGGSLPSLKGTTQQVLTTFTSNMKQPGPSSGPGFAIPCHIARHRRWIQGCLVHKKQPTPQGLP
jgi:hypothetical protein